jgi:hypothetical protein
MTEPSEMLEALILDFEHERWPDHKVNQIPWLHDLVRRLIAALREAQDGIIGSRSANTKLKVEIARLREALEPFAKEADCFDDNEPGDADPDDEKLRGLNIVVGDFRRARAALTGG